MNPDIQKMSYRSRTSTVCISSTSCNSPSTRLLGRRLGRRLLWLGRLGLVTASPFFIFYFYNNLFIQAGYIKDKFSAGAK
jgi:hypothetical protein